jgi:hypothetical protein
LLLAVALVHEFADVRRVGFGAGAALEGHC